MKYQVVIPARGGSKRLKGKNIIDLGGIPLIAHSILYAKRSLPDCTVYVNTDDQEIGQVARSFGAVVTERPPSLALDTTSSVEVLQHQLEWFSGSGIACDALILLQATNPLRPAQLIKESIFCFENSDRQSLAGFSVLNRKFGQIDSELIFHPENYQPGQRMQDLVPRYYENGLIYITRSEAIRNGQIITSDVYPLVVDHIFATVDIDEAHDLVYAAYILENNRENE